MFNKLYCTVVELISLAMQGCSDIRHNPSGFIYVILSVFHLRRKRLFKNTCIIVGYRLLYPGANKKTVEKYFHTLALSGDDGGGEGGSSD